MKVHRCIVYLVVSLLASSVMAQFSIQGTGVNPDDFEITTFASGLNFPIGMAELSDGSILTAVSNGTSFWSNAGGSLIRLIDTDHDGVADQQSTMVSNVPFGGLTTVRVAGDLVFTTGQGAGKPIQIYRMGATPSDPFTAVGSITINYQNQGWLHPHSALAAREVPGTPGQRNYELYFQLGSKTNFDDTTAELRMDSTIGVRQLIAGDAIHRVSLTDDGNTVTGAEVTEIATGLRNAAGFDFHPHTGDFYLQDNGIDGLVDANEPHSADELNVIPASDLGNSVADFGFPSTYTQYRTNTVVGDVGIQPLAAYQPIDGEEGEGPNDIAFAPPQFPAALRNGVFVGMHGKFSLGGLANEENPLIYTDATDGSYFHFIGNDEADVGHLNGLLSTQDSLFVADMSPGGGLGNSNSQSGKIYKIRSRLSPGDFDSDGDYSCADVDELVAEIVSGGNEDSFDLTGDGLVDALDLVAWRTEAGYAELASRKPYLPSDGNLDGIVDVQDFNLWNTHKFTNDSAFCSGDFNADGVVDVSDFNLWNGNKFLSALDTVLVPEPSSFLATGLLYFAWCLALARKSERAPKSR